MKTKLFCDLIEKSIVECYGVEAASSFEAVPYKDDDGLCKHCIGILIDDVVHMASVAAQAMLLMSKSDEYDEDDLFDFAMLMQLFRVAPYMQWTCIYFPGLTSDMEHTEIEEDGE
jgi:hypothetical protein